MGDTQYIDGINDAGVIATLQGKGMAIVGVPAKKVGDGQTQIGYCLDPKFALVRVQSVKLAKLERVVTRVAGRLSLGPAQRGAQETKASEVLKRMKKFRKRMDGSLNTSIEVAAGVAKQMKRDMFVWLGNSYMNAVWNVADNEAKALGPLENSGRFVFRVTPELDLFKHEVMGRLPGGSED